MRDFADQTSDADIAIVYFAGHGLEVDGSNYLIPVDAMRVRKSALRTIHLLGSKGNEFLDTDPRRV